MKVSYQYRGKFPYHEAVAEMERLMPEALSSDTVFTLGLEHPLVYTSGLRGDSEHILDESLQVVSSRRGGSVTLHNPGQLVYYLVYPAALAEFGLEGVVRSLEASLIETLWEYKVQAFLFPPHSGVWTRQGKIGFIGLGMKKNCIFHGLSVNISNDLGDFKKIRSCGLDYPLTRLTDELPACDEADLPAGFSSRLNTNFTHRFEKISPSAFRARIRMRLAEFPDPSMAWRVGMLYFNEKRFWEAHEAWEVIWHHYPAGSEFRIFIQGLIQLSSALFKMTRKINARGAINLLQKSREKISSSRYLKDLRSHANYRDESLTDYAGRLLEGLTLLEQTKVSEKEVRRIYYPFIMMLQHDFDSLHRKGLPLGEIAIK